MTKIESEERYRPGVRMDVAKEAPAPTTQAERCISFVVWLFFWWRGAIVGAGSVVTHDVRPFSTAVGNPARVTDTGIL